MGIPILVIWYLYIEMAHRITWAHSDFCRWILNEWSPQLFCHNTRGGISLVQRECVSIMGEPNGMEGYSSLNMKGSNEMGSKVQTKLINYHVLLVVLSVGFSNTPPSRTSCAHKWGQYTPTLTTTHLIQKYPIKISILQSCATQVGILQE